MFAIDKKGEIIISTRYLMASNLLRPRNKNDISLYNHIGKITHIRYTLTFIHHKNIL